MSAIVPDLRSYRAPDGQSLSVRVWQPLDQPHSQVLFLHGIMSHGGWYLKSCDHLASQGSEVHFLERRGSGLNVGQRGDVDRWQSWLRDVEAYLQILDDSTPRILAGISWGGKLAAAVARHRPELVDAVALICPGIFAYQQPRASARQLLKLARIPAIGRRRVRVPLIDPFLFTDSPTHVEYVRTDPLSIRQITLRFAYHDQRLTEYARGAEAKLSHPLLLVLAGRDRIVQNRRMRQYVDSMPTTNKRVCEYPLAGHTLEFESDPAPYFADLSQWIRDVSDAGHG